MVKIAARLGRLGAGGLVAALALANALMVPLEAAGWAPADFNKDGFGDLVIGAPGETVAGVPSAGAVHVIYGSAAGPAAAGNQLWDQDSPGVPEVGETLDQFGAAVATGDFNGDSFTDLAIGIPFEDISGAPDAGAVVVLYGSAAGLTAAGSQLFHQNIAGIANAVERSDWFGAALASGDFDADGKDDLAIGVPGEGLGVIASTGVVHVLYGSGAGLQAAGSQYWHQDTAGILGTAEAGDGFGSSLAAGRFNGDVFDDLAIGAPFEDVGAIADAGDVHVLLGSAARLTAGGNQDWYQNSPGILDVSEAGDRFGFALAAGRFNRDDFEDLAIGVPRENIGAVADAGAANVLYGCPAGLCSGGNQFWHQDSAGIPSAAEAGDNFGFSLAAGYMGVDGVEDLAVGVPYEDAGAIVDGGVVNVIYGTPNGLTGAGAQIWYRGVGGLPGAFTANEVFGFSVATGDFNGDFVGDLAMGIPGATIGGMAGAGELQVAFGAAAGITGAGNQLWNQNSAGILDAAEVLDNFAFSCAASHH